MEVMENMGCGTPGLSGVPEAEAGTCASHRGSSGRGCGLRPHAPGASSLLQAASAGAKPLSEPHTRAPRAPQSRAQPQRSIVAPSSGSAAGLLSPGPA